VGPNSCVTGRNIGDLATARPVSCRAIVDRYRDPASFSIPIVSYELLVLPTYRFAFGRLHAMTEYDWLNRPLLECVDSFQQIVPTRSQFSGKGGVFWARRIGDSGFLFSGGNIYVEEINDTGEIGDQDGYLGRLPHGVDTPKMALVFHIVTSKWSSLAHLENLAAYRRCRAIPAPGSRTGETNTGPRRREPAGCLARAALKAAPTPFALWLRCFQLVARGRRRLLPGRPAA
jgi:hypothetical protein